MSGLLADTSFFVAFINRADQAHASAYSYMTPHRGPIFTSQWVLVEFGNFLSETRERSDVKKLASSLQTDRRFRIIPARSSDFQAGLDLYDDRPDKEWSLTDCISFAIMRERKLRDALTTDHHFRQAGFRVLL